MGTDGERSSAGRCDSDVEINSRSPVAEDSRGRKKDIWPVTFNCVASTVVPLAIRCERALALPGRRPAVIKPKIRTRTHALSRRILLLICILMELGEPTDNCGATGSRRAPNRDDSDCKRRSWSSGHLIGPGSKESNERHFLSNDKDV